MCIKDTQANTNKFSTQKGLQIRKNGRDKVSMGLKPKPKTTNHKRWWYKNKNVIHLFYSYNNTGVVA